MVNSPFKSEETKELEHAKVSKEDYMFHSLYIVYPFLALCVVSLICQNPAYLAFYFSILMLSILLTKKFRKCVYLLIAVSFFGLIILGANLVFAKSGASILYEKHIVGAFSIRVSMESLIFGLTMFEKLLVVSMLFWFLGEVVRVDLVSEKLARVAPKTLLIFSISFLMLPRLKRRIIGAKRALNERLGKPLKSKKYGRFEKWKFLTNAHLNLLILKFCVVTALEDAWSVSAALFARGYRIEKRSSFKSNEKKAYEIVEKLISYSLCLTLLVSLLRAQGAVNFYPKFILEYNISDLLLNVVVWSGFVWILRKVRGDLSHV